MTTYIIVILFIVIVLFFMRAFGRKICYWNSPSLIIDRVVKEWAVSVHVFSSILFAAFLHIGLDNLFYIDKQLDNYPLARIISIAGEFGMLIIPVGILVDRYFVSTNPEFKKWRESKISC